ncbi:MAG: hypothetical protein LZ166_02110 [Thaumarchaeota archaeon]|nr:hypothetical protein [Candidatus Wolframiiraptor allenii]
MMMDPRYKENLSRASALMREFGREFGEAILVFHDDADGLCAGAIMSLVLERLGIPHRLICVEKLSPEVVELIHAQGEKLYLYTDIGSGRADLIALWLGRSGGAAVIVDHHDPVEAAHPRLLHLNPELYGYEGESDVSGSAAAYLLAKEIFDARDAAWMAVVGSAEIPGKLRELNRIALEDAVAAGDVEIVSENGEEAYRVKFLGKLWRELSSTLSAIGSVGYYMRGPQDAVEHLKRRMIPENLAERFEDLRRRRFAQAFAIIAKTGLRKSAWTQWYHLRDLFKGLGSKTIGTLSSMLSYRKGVDPDRYIIGFMNFEPEIPGLGRIRGSWVKFSVRAPRRLSSMIENGSMPSISELAVKASEKVGGSADGHKFAASGLIPSGTEENFIQEFDDLVGRLKSQ